MNASLARSPVLIADEAGIASKPAPAPRVYRRAYRGLVLLGDVLAVSFGVGAAAAAVWRLTGAQPSLGSCAAVVAFVIAAFGAHALYEKSYAIVRRDEFYYAAAISLLCAAVAFPVLLVIDVSAPSRIAAGVGLVLSGITIGMFRYCMRGAIGEHALFIERNAMVAGAPPGPIEPWLDEICRDGVPRHLVIDQPKTALHANALARAAARRGIVVALASESPWAQLGKRAFDVVVSLIALAVSAPLILLAALAVRVEDGGPALYSQPRIGRDGTIFSILKLRSMRSDAETTSGPVWAVEGDARVTTVGRFLRRTSIDELPQLINVLRGDMSIVGPRPERPVFVDTFSAKLPLYRERLIVSPGLTACSHLYMSRTMGSEAVDERLNYDLFYVRNWSLAMDIALILKTAAEVVFHRAA